MSLIDKGLQADEIAVCVGRNYRVQFEVIDKIIDRTRRVMTYQVRALIDGKPFKDDLYFEGLYSVEKLKYILIHHACSIGMLPKNVLPRNILENIKV